MITHISFDENKAVGDFRQLMLLKGILDLYIAADPIPIYNHQHVTRRYYINSGPLYNGLTEYSNTYTVHYLPIISMDIIPSFVEWCNDYNITVSVKKRIIGVDKIW